MRSEVRSKVRRGRTEEEEANTDLLASMICCKKSVMSFLLAAWRHSAGLIQRYRNQKGLRIRVTMWACD